MKACFTYSLPEPEIRALLISPSLKSMVKHLILCCLFDSAVGRCNILGGGRKLIEIADGLCKHPRGDGMCFVLCTVWKLKNDT